MTDILEIQASASQPQRLDSEAEGDAKRVRNPAVPQPRFAIPIGFFAFLLVPPLTVVAATVAIAIGVVLSSASAAR